MFRDLSVILIMASLAFVSTASGTETKSSDSSKPLDKVGEEVVKLLGMRMNLNVSDVTLVVALDWYMKLAENPVPIKVSEGAAKRKSHFNSLTPHGRKGCDRSPHKPEPNTE